MDYRTSPKKLNLVEAYLKDYLVKYDDMDQIVAKIRNRYDKVIIIGITMNRYTSRFAITIHPNDQFERLRLKTEHLDTHNIERVKILDNVMAVISYLSIILSCHLEVSHFC